MMNRIVLTITFLTIVLCGFRASQDTLSSGINNNPLDSILSNNASLKDVWINTDIHKLQIIYTRIIHDKLGNVKLQDYSYNLSENLYFYPASLVKLPASIFALEKINSMKNIEVTKNSKISIESNYSCQSAVIIDRLSDDSIPTLSNYISKALIISDNDAYNRLYEFVGPEYCQKRLDEMGYNKARIITRFSRCNSSENRHTNGFNFYNHKGEVIYKQRPAFYNLPINPPIKNMNVGSAHFKKREIIPTPKNFSNSNFFPLENIHNFLIGLIYPSIYNDPFLINPKDREFVLKCLAAKPSECSIQKISTDTAYYDNYTNYLYYGSENKATSNNKIKIHNIVGQSYGFLSDVAYFKDKENKIEFFLSAVIYANSSELVGSNGYDYDTIGFPFLRDLGKSIYEYELKDKYY